MAQENVVAHSIVRDLLLYVEELETSLDAADESLAAEGGCGTGEWREGDPKFMPREERLDYIRNAEVLERARAWIAENGL